MWSSDVPARLLRFEIGWNFQKQFFVTAHDRGAFSLRLFPAVEPDLGKGGPVSAARYLAKGGCAGGDWGAAGEMHILEIGSEPEPAPKFGLRRLNAGRLSASSPGGGGWGRPTDRPVEAVWRDWRDGLVSTETARDAYGVVFYGDPDDPASGPDAVDTGATEALRRDGTAKGAGDA